MIIVIFAPVDYQIMKPIVILIVKEIVLVQLLSMIVISVLKEKLDYQKIIYKIVMAFVVELQLLMIAVYAQVETQV